VSTKTTKLITNTNSLLIKLERTTSWASQVNPSLLSKARNSYHASENIVASSSKVQGCRTVPNEQQQGCRTVPNSL